MSEKKDWAVTIRVKKEEYLWIEKAAKSEDLSISCFLRRTVVKFLRGNYPLLEPIDDSRRLKNLQIEKY